MTRPPRALSTLIACIYDCAGGQDDWAPVLAELAAYAGYYPVAGRGSRGVGTSTPTRAGRRVRLREPDPDPCRADSPGRIPHLHDAPDPSSRVGLHDLLPCLSQLESHVRGLPGRDVGDAGGEQEPPPHFEPYPVGQPTHRSDHTSGARGWGTPGPPGDSDPGLSHILCEGCGVNVKNAGAWEENGGVGREGLGREGHERVLHRVPRARDPGRRG